MICAYLRLFNKEFAEEGTRTPTAFRPPAPKAGASANSATSARNVNNPFYAIARIVCGFSARAAIPGVRWAGRQAGRVCYRAGLFSVLSVEAVHEKLARIVLALHIEEFINFRIGGSEL